MERCKHKLSDTDDMIRCCFCFVWYHEDCIDVGSLADKGVSWWVCPTCRMMPTSIAVLTSIATDMRGSLEQLLSSNTALVAAVNYLQIWKCILDDQNWHASIKIRFPVHPCWVQVPPVEPVNWRLDDPRCGMYGPSIAKCHGAWGC